MAKRAFDPSPFGSRSDPHIHPNTRSQFSTSSCTSSISGLSSPSKPSFNESIYTFDFKSTPSLSLSSVRSTQTLNYDPRQRRMSVPVRPNARLAQEKLVVNLATKKQLDDLTTAHPLPELAQGKWKQRWRTFRYGTMSAYMRLWALVILTNIIVNIAMTCKHSRNPGSFTYAHASTAAGANLLVAALSRQEHCINLIFRLATGLPQRTPLTIRRQAAKVYSYGGVHSGCGISALLWYIIYIWLSIDQFRGSQAETTVMAATTALTLLCLVVIIGMAHPKIRTRWHDQWEVSHRFAGWTAIGLVWAQTMVIAVAAAHQTGRSIALLLLETPTFWLLMVITCCLIYPWLRTRRRNVEAEVLSSHAVRLWFGGKTMPSCVGARLAHRPLTENHGFATIPNAKPTPRDLEAGLAEPEEAHTRSRSSSETASSASYKTACSTLSGSSALNTPMASTTASATDISTKPSTTTTTLTSISPTRRSRGKGFSILVSRAGDFTSSLIDNPPTHIWTRGAPTCGVLRIATLFRPVILIATGSGIGPCLSFLQVYPDYPLRVIWSARNPLQTYCSEVVGAVLRADPQAMILDTQEEGMKRPDLGALGYALARSEGAEAVVIISNPTVTRKVVFALESRGFPAFGAIFDS